MKERDRRKGRVEKGTKIGLHKYNVRDREPIDRDTDQKVAKMYPLVIINFLLLMWLVEGQTVALDDPCNRQEVKQGCSVNQGHALCASWNFSSSIHGLPSCTTGITFSLLADPNSINKTIKATTSLNGVNQPSASASRILY